MRCDNGCVLIFLQISVTRQQANLGRAKAVLISQQIKRLIFFFCCIENIFGCAAIDSERLQEPNTKSITQSLITEQQTAAQPLKELLKTVIGNR